METEYLCLHSEGALKPKVWVLETTCAEEGIIGIGKVSVVDLIDIYSPPATA